jgi:hypothetical protein
MVCSKQMVVGLVVLAAAIFTIRAVSQEPAPTTPPEPQLGSLTSLRGLDVAVRSEGEADFGEKTPRVALEAFRDEDFGTLTYMTAKGSIAVIPQPANFELRHLPFDRFYETVRFSPIAGIAWRLNLRTAKWQMIEEPNILVPGNYDIDMFHVTEDSMVAMRIDQLTGRTWTLVSEDGKPDRWQEIAEPDAPKTSESK